MRYPAINLRSKNELAKRISAPGFSKEEALGLINDVLENSDKYWKDSAKSDVEKEKFVRSAVGTPLGRLLQKIDGRVLAPHDRLAPGFVFGGLSGKNHVQAARHLLGKKRSRTLLSLDLRRFFEQIDEDRVIAFFRLKAGCTRKAATILARLCCVPTGPKGKPGAKRVLARGFATSTRLSLWCNLNIFSKINRHVQKMLKDKDPRLAIFVDDIGITASSVEPEEMEKVATEVEGILSNFDKNQPLASQPEKRQIKKFSEGAQHLGLKLGRTKLALGSKARSRKDKIRKLLATTRDAKDRGLLLRQLKAYKRYERYVQP